MTVENDNQLKTAAEALQELSTVAEAQQAKIAEQQTRIEELEASAAQAKTASAEANRGTADLAKHAAQELRDAGLISTDERRDQFATEVLTHDNALRNIAKFAQVHASAPRTGQVVSEQPVDSQTKTADDAWNEALSQYAR